MPALRQSVKRRRVWIFFIVATGIAVAAIGDWTKPATTQASVQFYNRAVVIGYFRYVRPITSRFVRCRFQPTCSIYSITAMQTHGFPKGIVAHSKTPLPLFALGSLGHIRSGAAATSSEAATGHDPAAQFSSLSIPRRRAASDSGNCTKQRRTTSGRSIPESQV